MVSLSTLLFLKKPEGNREFELFAEEETLKFNSSDEFVIPGTEAAEHFGITPVEDFSSEFLVTTIFDTSDRNVYSQYFRLSNQQNATLEALTNKTTIATTRHPWVNLGGGPSVALGHDQFVYRNVWENDYPDTAGVMGQFVARNGSSIRLMGDDFLLHNNTICFQSGGYLDGDSADSFMAVVTNTRESVYDDEDKPRTCSKGISAREFKENVGGPDITLTTCDSAITQSLLYLPKQDIYLAGWEHECNPGDEILTDLAIQGIRFGKVMWDEPQEVSTGKSSWRNQNGLVMVEMEGGSVFAAWSTTGRRNNVTRQSSDIVGKIFNVTQTGLKPWAPEFQINNINILNGQSNPSITRLTTGQLVVVWQNPQEISAGVKKEQIYGRCFDRETGQPETDEFPISLNTEFENYNPLVIPFSNGSFFTAWSRRKSLDEYADIAGRFFASCPKVVVPPLPPGPRPIWPYLLGAGGGAAFIAFLARKNIWNCWQERCGDGNPAYRPETAMVRVGPAP